MRLLLDSNAVLWWLAGDERLGDDPLALIDDPFNDVAVSAASVWELGIKQALGKLDLADGYHETLTEEGIDLLPITPAHALAAAALPAHHRDPFDRMIIAQAQRGGYAVVTADRRFADYGVAVVAAR